LEDYNPSYPTKNYKNGNSLRTSNWRFNLFLEPQIRFAGYNATLEGLMFKDEKSVRKILPSDVKRILFEMNGGLNLQIYDVLYLKYMVFARSREYEGGKPIHLWGGITVGLSCAKWFRE
jgi:hypothetical protein